MINMSIHYGTIRIHSNKFVNHGNNDYSRQGKLVQDRVEVQLLKHVIEKGNKVKGANDNGYYARFVSAQSNDRWLKMKKVTQQ